LPNKEGPWNKLPWGAENNPIGPLELLFYKPRPPKREED